MSAVDLADYGLDDGRRGEIEGSGASLDVVGRLVRVERGEVDVMTTAGERRAVSDSMRSQDELAPSTGDWVVLADLEGVGLAVDRILGRRHTLVRRDPSEAVVEQVLVANIDRVFIVHGLDRPLHPGRIERFLVLVWASGATPHVILTKSDRARDLDEVVATLEAIAPEVDVVVTSAKRHEGLQRIGELLAPRTTTALIGESGSGKSSLVNALLEEERQSTAEVRERDAKGRHTTVTRDLVLVDGHGLVIDTPGIRAVGLWGGEEALATVFADIVELARECRFNDCAHDAEPGCAVSGTVPPRRLDRYRAMLAEIEAQREREAARERRRGGRRR